MRNSLVKNIVYNAGVIIAIVAVFLMEEIVVYRLHVLYQKRDIVFLLEQERYLDANTFLLIHISFALIALMYCLAMRLSQLKWWKLVLSTVLLVCLFFTQLNNGSLLKPYSMYDEQKQWIFMSVVIGILITISSYLLIIFAQRDYNIQLKKQILKLGMLHTQNEIEQIERSYTNTRVLKHDMKHLLGVILSLLKRGDFLTAEKEIETIIGKQLTTDIIHMQSNVLINAVVNNKINICKENDILYEVKLIGDISKEQEMNVAVILSNLIDNAIEAELKETERIIKLDMFPVKDMYSIVVCNKLSESVLASNAGLKTTKALVHEHGLGKVSVDNLVNQMHGIYKFYEEDGYFITTILFSNNKFVP